MKTALAFCICFFLLSGLGWAQPGISEMQHARQDLASTFFSAFDFSLVIAGIFGILGALRIYHNAQMGREELPQMSPPGSLLPYL